MVLSVPRLFIATGVGLLLILSGCSRVESISQFTPPGLTPEVTSAPTAGVPPQKVRVLSICLGEEPESLFPFRDNSPAAAMIRQAVYDGPVDLVNYREFPAVLERIPAQENGDVRFQPVLVQPGDKIVNASGQLSRLVSGTRFRPAGCRAADCEAVYQGEDSVEVDQLVIDFHLIPGLRWSDGEPVTVSDSLYSYQVALDILGNHLPRKYEVTESYRMISETRVRWRGVPGFQSPYYYSSFFFMPLPEHAWGELTPEELLISDQVNRTPLGWGPYILDTWKTGDHLGLSANPYFHGWSSEGPSYDRLVFRFLRDIPEALLALSAGECDLAAGFDGWPEFYDQLTDLETEGTLRLVYQQGGAWEQITFGAHPRGDRTPFFASPAVRQAVGYCINRPALINMEPRAGSVAASYVPGNHPGFSEEVDLYPFNPRAGERLLEQSGWIDDDVDPATPRVAQAVEDIPDGTPFVVSLLVFEGEEADRSVRLIKENLNACGIDVTVEGLPPNRLLAPGPDGPIFGRGFDLARFAWIRGHFQMCSLFTSDEVPGPPPEYGKGWGGANAGGYQNPAFDLACRASRSNLPDSSSRQEGFKTAQHIFAEDLPALPLYFRREVLLAAPDFLAVHSGSGDLLWDLEEWE